MNNRVVYTDQGIILAAGLGTRLGWLTRDYPKALMPIAGVPVIIRVIRRMVAAGIRHIVINVHHHAALIQATLGDGHRFGVALYYSMEHHLLDSGGGVRQALLHLPSVTPVLVHNADIFSSIDLHKLQRQHSHADSVLAMVNNPTHHPKGDFTVNQGYIYHGVGRRCTFSGVSFWQPEAILARPAGMPFSLVELIHEQVKKQRCSAIVHSGLWFDIGRPSDLIQASRHTGVPRSL